MASATNRITVGDRLGAASGAAYVLLTVVGNQLDGGNSTDPHPSGTKDLAGFADASGAGHRIGFPLEFLGFVAFIVFLGWLLPRLWGRGGVAASLGVAAGISGGVTVAVKVASLTPVIAGQIDHSDITPSMARVLLDMNSASFSVSIVTFGAFLAATGGAFLASGFLGKVAGSSAVAIGVLDMAVVLATQADPTKSNPLPFVASLLWMLVVSIRLAWKGPRTAVLDPAGARVSVAA